jgi:hypothetical protein
MFEGLHPKSSISKQPQHLPYARQVHEQPIRASFSRMHVAARPPRSASLRFAFRARLMDCLAALVIESESNMA